MAVAISDVSCCVFPANRIGRAAQSGDKVQIAWQVWHLVRCDEKWRKLRTKHPFFEVASFQLHVKTRSETSIFESHLLKSRGSLARNVRFEAPTCLLLSLWLSCGVAVSIGEAAKHVWS